MVSELDAVDEGEAETEGVFEGGTDQDADSVSGPLVIVAVWD